MDQELDFHENYEYLKHFQDSQTPVLYHKLKVSHENHHVHQREDDIRTSRLIIAALSTMEFHDVSVFAQYWAAIDFQSRFVLTTCGQPHGHSMDSTIKFGPYRAACLDHNSYVGRNKGECTGPPARVFHNQSPEWIQDVRRYNEKQYPQLQDAQKSNIRGSLFMPVIEGGQCIGVLEVATTNPKNDFKCEMDEVCRALESAGLNSSVQNENISFDTSEEDCSLLLESRNTPIKRRRSKSKAIARKDITKLFGLCKADAIKICCSWYNFKTLSENTFTKAHRKYGVCEWPCTRSGIVKSSAHKALIEHGKTFLTKSDVAHSSFIESEDLCIREPTANVKTVKGSKQRRGNGKDSPSLSIQTNGVSPLVFAPQRDILGPYKKFIPSMFHPYITHLQDVQPDGNCGFRSIAAGLSLHESLWHNVRLELLGECNLNHDLYKNIDEEAYAKVLDSLDWNETTPAPMSKWLQMPYTGIMISNRWKIMLHLLSDKGCATFFPLSTKAEDHLPHHSITIVHVNSNHFIMIRLEGDYPIPTPSGYWEQTRHPIAESWSILYSERIERYKQVVKCYKNRDYIDIGML